MTTSTVGFIGLGVMGGPMALNMLKEISGLRVFDTAADAIERLETQGAKRSGSAREIMESCDTVFLSVPGKVVPDLFHRSLEPALRPGSCIVDLSSTGPAAAKVLAERAAAQGADILDAPVTGGASGAAAGTLTLMVGGREEAFRSREKLISHLGTPYYIGEAGTGQIVKLVNNLIVGVNYAGAVEAFALAAKAGIEPRALYRVLEGGAASSWVLNRAAHCIINDDYRPGGTVALHTRDLRNALDLAAEVKAPAPVTALVHEMFLASMARGDANETQAAIVRVWSGLAGRPAAAAE